MSVPYSDNLYSALDDDDSDDDAYAQPVSTSPLTGNTQQQSSPSVAPVDSHHHHVAADDEDEVLSPSDGYFRASDATSYTPQRQSSNVPDVPNVLVEDPTLRDDERDTKTREAEHERRLSTMAALQTQTPQAQDQSTNPLQSPSAGSSRPGHSHRRSVEEDDDQLEELNENTQGPLSPQQQPQQQHQRPSSSRPNETSPLFQQHPIDAPPAYTPSPPSQSHQSPTPRSPLSPSSATPETYQTFGSPPPSSAGMGLPATETSRLLAATNREPESMGGEPGDEAPRTFVQRVKRAFRLRDGRRRLSTVLKWLLVIVIVAMVISTFTIYGDHHSDGGSDKDPGYVPEPVLPDPEPTTPPGGSNPNKPKTPAPTPPDTDHGELTWKHRSYCRRPDNSHHVLVGFASDFSGSSSLSIQQHPVSSGDEQPANARHPHIEGEVILRRSPHPGPEGTLKIEVISNHESLEAETHVGFYKQELRVETAASLAWRFEEGPCIQMRVTVHVPEGAALEGLAVNATQLDINVLEGLDLRVAGEALLHSVTGDVTVPEKKEGKSEPYYIGKRRTVVKTVSGDVKGWFKLNDLLKIGTVSGDVDVAVEAGEVDHDDPKQAELMVKTVSGDVTVKEPINNRLTTSAKHEKDDSDVPGRDYTVDLMTSSGTITASVAFTSKANVQSMSGDLYLSFLPVLDPSNTHAGPDLQTETKSGTSKVEVLEPLWKGIEKPRPGKDQRLEGPDEDKEKDGKGEEPWIIIHPHDGFAGSTTTTSSSSSASPRPLGNLISRHASISGTLKIRYPASWEGGITAQTVSGTQKVRGEDLKIWEMMTPLMKTVGGRKGNGASNLKIASVSGDEDVLIGKEGWEG